MYVYTGFGGIIGGSCIFFRDSNSNSANYQTLLPWRPSLWIKYASQTSLRTPLCLVWSHHSSSKASLPAEPCLALFPFHSCLQNAGWEKETGSQGVDMRLFYLLLSPLVIRDSLYSVLVFSHSLVSYVFGKHLLQALCLQQSEILVLLVDLSIDSRTQRLFFFFFEGTLFTAVNQLDLFYWHRCFQYWLWKQKLFGRVRPQQQLHGIGTDD